MANEPVSEVVLQVRVEPDVVAVRREVRTCAVALGFDLVRQTKIVTAASEIIAPTTRLSVLVMTCTAIMKTKVVEL